MVLLSIEFKSSNELSELVFLFFGLKTIESKSYIQLLILKTIFPKYTFFKGSVSFLNFSFLS